MVDSGVERYVSVGVWNFFVIAFDLALDLVRLSSSFVLRLDLLWGCCSQKEVPLKGPGLPIRLEDNDVCFKLLIRCAGVVA